jgi:hypothetical protein
MSGCYKPHTIVGQWSTRADVGSGTLIFRDDCTFRAMRETPLMTLILDGTYEYKGESLKLHVVKWSVPKGPKINNEERIALNTEFQTDARSTVSWTDDDHVRISGANGDLTTAERISK